MHISYKNKLSGSYEICRLGISKINNGDLLKEHRFRFKTRKNKTYIVDVEEYTYNVFAIKFYLKNYQHSKDKYKMLCNDFDGFRVVSTVVAVVLYIIDSVQPLASFGFIGTPLLIEPTTLNTKRFRIYQKLAQKYFSPDTFDHGCNIDNSSYLLLNKKVVNINLKVKVEEMFNRLYIN
jgi:hypothetical protein